MFFMFKFVFRDSLFRSSVGFEVYLVGGCVRDLILRRVPKDFDILTSAELKDVSLHCASIRFRGIKSCHLKNGRLQLTHQTTKVVTDYVYWIVEIVHTILWYIL